MKLTVDLTKEKGFRIRTGQNIFLCDQAVESAARPAALMPVEMFIASLASSITAAGLGFCKEHFLSAQGLRVTMEWEFAGQSKRIGRIDASIHKPDSLPAEMDDDFMSALHTCEVYQTLELKPEMHFHATTEMEKPEGEALVHFAGAE